jgi:predicted GIY-YIG superfamily endonuclease
MSYVYILQSEKDGKFYTGWTKDLKSRIKEHNEGKVLSTKHRRPFKLIYYEFCLNEKDAIRREKYLKTAWGKRYIKSRLKNYLTGQGDKGLIMKDFLFDIEDYKNIPGLQRPWDRKRPYLVPVFFKKQVLLRYLFEPEYKCEFYSETYGIIDNGKNWVPFGINPNGLVIMWLGDIDTKLGEKEKLYLLSYNVKSDHNIHSEFYDAQINIIYPEPIKEVSILISKNKLNKIFSEKFGFKLFITEYQDDHSLFEICRKYKKILFNNEDDFKNVINEWNKEIIEDINKEDLKNYLKNINTNVDFNELGSIKLLKEFIINVLNLPDALLEPYFILYDLRTWADHRVGKDKFIKAIQELGLDKNAKYIEIYQTLLNKILSMHEFLINKLRRWG